MINNQLVEQGNGFIEMQLNKDECGLIINVDERKCLQYVEKIETNIGFCYQLNEKNGLYGKTQIMSRETQSKLNYFRICFHTVLDTSNLKKMA